MSGANIQLSPEQENILKTCRAPNDDEKKRPLVRVTAAAGTGKTTTLLALAKQAAKLGHKRITYLTFNRSAAQDAVRRLGKVQGLIEHGTVVDGRTLHSCARRLIQLDDEGLEDGTHPTFVDDTKLEKLIAEYSNKEIKAFLQQVWSAPEKSERNQETQWSWDQRHRERAIIQVVFFIRKSLVQFCRGKLSLQELADHDTNGRDYYPANKFHQADGNGPSMGFSPDKFTDRKLKFYADEAHRLFGLFQSRNILSHDMVMKRAQLSKCRIPDTTLLLVDESQDLDGCQIDWAWQQHQLYGTHVYFVGDCAQSIYSFRGAKAKNLISIDGVTDDCTLTVSWRFGESIARVANCALFCKEKSPHTPPPPNPEKDLKYQKCPNWRPYRVTGGAFNNPGTVTNESILPQWKHMKVTIIASANVTLLVKAVSLLGMHTVIEEKDKDSDVEENGDHRDEDNLSEERAAVSPIADASSVDDDDIKAIDIPKFYINGKGQSSGRNKWKRVLKEVKELAALFLAGQGDGEENGGALQLDPKLFPEFRNLTITWEAFKEEVDNRELSKYSATIGVIDKFRNRALEAIELFEKEVLNKEYSEEEADVVLTTCHAAKGMEWDNVEVCGDFCNVWDTAKLIGPRIRIENVSSSSSASNPPCVSAPSSPTTRQPDNDSSSPVIVNPYKKAKTEKAKFRDRSYQFNCKPSKDDVNLVYVAFTRAKRTLSINYDLWKFLHNCDFLHDWIQAEEKVKIVGSFLGVEIKEETKNVEELYHDLIMPLRKENGMANNQSLSEVLVSTYPGENNPEAVAEENEDTPPESGS